MSFGFDVSELLQSIQHLETLAKARLAERRTGPIDVMRIQLARFGVCACSCHFHPATVHTGQGCCGNARIGDSSLG
jgi:hypothetical protein